MSRTFDNPFWNDTPDPSRMMRMVDDLQLDPDEKPSAKVQSRIAHVARRQRIASLIGAYQVCTHVEGSAVAVAADTKRAVSVIWSSRRVLVLRATLDEDTSAVLALKHNATVVGVPRGQDLLAALEARFGCPP